MLTLTCSLLALFGFVAYRHLVPGGIIFYEAVVMALLASAAQGAWMRMRGATWASTFKDATYTLLLLYAFAFTVPTTVDRAYSVRLLLEVQKSRDGLSRGQIEQWFATDFRSQGGVEKRLGEQMATGSISVKDDRYVLTQRGEFLTSSFRAVQRVFNTTEWRP